jgi:UDP-GlcNAc:undecaprenyl-phosphate GlcNAc-1-phosphate transferase
VAELFFSGALLAAAIAALLFTPPIRAWARAVGLVDRPGERKIHTMETAYGGGLAVALALALVLAAGLWLREEYFPGWPKNMKELSGWPLAAICGGAFCALLLGLVDDKYKLSPGPKLLVEFCLAGAAVAAGVRITAFIGDNLLTQSATICWIVLITNSFNLLDNMDGLCAGVAAIAAAMLGLVALDSGQWNLMIALGALSGACLGFFKYNRSPASIFLGDAGSLFLGFMLACLAPMVNYYRAERANHLAIGIPLLIMAIPLYDTCSVILIRLKEHRPVMRGDTSHFSHRLVDLGMSRRQAVFTIHLACLAISLPAIVLGSLPEERGFLIIGQALLVLTLIALLEHAGRKKQKNL